MFSPTSRFKTQLHGPAARCARVVQESSAPKNRGRGECRAPDAPAASRAMMESTRVSHHRSTGITRHSRTRMVLRLIPRSPRRRIRLVTVIGGLKALPDPVGPAKTSADLTPATGARTTRFCRPRSTFAKASADKAVEAFGAGGSSIVRQPAVRSLTGHDPPCDYARARRCRVHRIPSQRP